MMDTKKNDQLTNIEFDEINEPKHVHGPSCNHGHSLKPIERSAPKLGRNDPCKCGSGKKLKKCCG